MRHQYLQQQKNLILEGSKSVRISAIVELLVTKQARCLSRADSADIGDCRLQVHKENWTATWSCDVIKVYSSAADYGITLYQRYRKVSLLFADELLHTQ